MKPDLNSIIDNRNNTLVNIISPAECIGMYTTLNKIINSEKTGQLHLLYSNFQITYGDNGLLTNINVPYIDPIKSDSIKSTKKNKVIRDLIIINNPEDVERLANNHIKKMPNLKPFLGNSIISITNVDDWKTQRGCYTPSFSVSTELNKLIPTSNDRAILAKDILWSLSNNGTNIINISDFFLSETQAQLQLALFGFSNEFQKKTNKNIRKMFSGEKMEYVKEFVPKFLKELEFAKGPLGKNMYYRFNQLNNHSNSEMIGNSLIFSFAGHDTTGHTLSWLIYELSKNHTIQNKLSREVDEFWNKQKDKDILYPDFKRLPFMTRCIMEILRLWPAIPNGTYRELINEDYIIGKNGAHIILPKGTYIQIPNWSRHRSSDLWGNDVDIFNPDREFKDDELWNNTVINSYNPSSERFSPFTYGPRDCIGKNFSQIEMRLILLHLLRSFTFNLTNKQKTCYDSTTIGFNSFTFGPRNIENNNLRDSTLGLYVTILPRQIKSKL